MMDRLKTNELSLGLDQGFRGDLIDNFEKIQNGIDGQGDALNKQIEDMLGNVPLQDQNEVTQARIDRNGKPYETLKGREDATQATAETAFKTSSSNQVELTSARTDISGVNYETLGERLDDYQESLQKQIYDFLSQKNYSPVVVDTLDDLKKDYPTGASGIFIVSQDGHKYFWYNDKWNDGGVYQAAGDYQNISDNILLNNQFQNGTLNGIKSFGNSIVLSMVSRNNRKWAFAKSNDSVSTNRGLTLSVAYAPSEIGKIHSGYYQFDTLILSDIETNLYFRALFYDINGNILGAKNFDESLYLHGNRVVKYSRSIRLTVPKGTDHVDFTIVNMTNADVSFYMTNYHLYEKREENNQLSNNNAYVESKSFGNLTQNPFFINDTDMWINSGDATTVYPDFYNGRAWLHVKSNGTAASGLGALYEENSYGGLFKQLQGGWSRSSIKFMSFKNGRFGIKALYQDANGTYVTSKVVKTFYVANPDPVTINFDLPKMPTPDLSKISIFVFNLDNSALDFRLTEFLSYGQTQDQSLRAPKSDNFAHNSDFKEDTYPWYGVGTSTSLEIVKMYNRNWLHFNGKQATESFVYAAYDVYANETEDEFAKTKSTVIELDLISPTKETYSYWAFTIPDTGRYSLQQISVEANVPTHIKVVVPAYQLGMRLGLCRNGGAATEYYISNFQLKPYIGIVGENSSQTSTQSNIARIDLNGDISGMSKDVEKTLSVAFSESGNNFTGFAKVKWQGDSSLSYPKKNLKLKLYSDSDLINKLKIKPRSSWLSNNTFNLKANYIDVTQSLNLVTGAVYNDISTSQKNKPDEFKKTSFNAQIQGFPVLVYINGNFTGLYTFNQAKSAKLYNVDESNPNSMVLASTYGGDQGFNKDSFVISSDAQADFELENPDTLTDVLQQQANELGSFVKNASDSDFVANYSQHLNLDSVIDFLIFYQIAMLSDSTNKNIEYATYDGKVWSLIPYDLDSTWGLHWDGKTLLDTKTNMFVDHFDPTNTYISLGANRLLKRTYDNFKPQLKTRYDYLRQSSLTPVSVLDKFKTFIDKVGTENYKADVALWPNIPSSKILDYQVIEQNVNERFEVCDEIFANL